jgi:hypothetical protein
VDKVVAESITSESVVLPAPRPVPVSDAITEGPSIDKSIIKLVKSPTVPCDWGTMVLEPGSDTELMMGGSPRPDASRILIMRSKPDDSAPRGLCGAEHDTVVGEVGRFNGGDGGLEYRTIRQRVIWATSWPNL